MTGLRGIVGGKSSTQSSVGTESAKQWPPALGVVLGTLGFLPLVGCALLALRPQIAEGGTAVAVAVPYGGCLLCFLGGVRRGFSFRQRGGPTVAQLATTMWLFAVGVMAILLHWPTAALVLLLVGFVSALILDALAAGWDEVPKYFRVLRPVQCTVAIASVMVLLVRAAAG